MANILDIKYGVASFVELTKKHAYKYMKFDELYWIREYSLLLNIWYCQHPSFTQFLKAEFLYYQDFLFLKLKFRKFYKTLHEVHLNTDKQIIQCILDILYGIMFLHSKNIIHRDIKLSNILIGRNGRCKIIDFSHSVINTNKNIIMDSCICTYTHRAPEVFLYREQVGSPYNQSIDVWSAGIILMELVCKLDFDMQFNEEEMREFISIENEDVFLKRLKRMYSKNKNKKLIWSKVFWVWIRKMLCHNPNNRVSALNIYNEIVEFSYEMRLNVVVNEKFPDSEVKKNHKPVKLTNICDINRFNLLQETAKMFPLIGYFNCDLRDLDNIFHQIVLDHFIINLQICPIAISVYIIVSVFIYDAGIMCLSNFINDFNEKYNEKIKKDDIYICMQYIIAKYDKDLFLLDTFDLIKS